jgi:hypothetical protein
MSVTIQDEEDLTAEERERATLVSHLLYDLFTRKRWHRISVRQWINRLLLLYQRPLIVLVYRKCGQW